MREISSRSSDQQLKVIYGGTYSALFHMHNVWWICTVSAAGLVLWHHITRAHSAGQLCEPELWCSMSIHIIILKYMYNECRISTVGAAGHGVLESGHQRPQSWPTKTCTTMRYLQHILLISIVYTMNAESVLWVLLAWGFIIRSSAAAVLTQVKWKSLLNLWCGCG